MRELFLLEHRKLWRKRSVKVSVMLCFLYMVVFGGILSYQWFSFGSSGDPTSAFGNHFDGYSMIRESQEYAALFQGELTEETLQRMVKAYQQLESADKKQELERTDWRVINNWLSVLYPELRQTDVYKTMISYVRPEQLNDFYERRRQAINTFLENNGQTSAEKEYLMQMEERVSKPFQYGWVRGWSELLGSGVVDLGIVMALFLVLVLSPLFSGEWHDNAGSLILTTRNGWRELAAAKIMTGFAFTLELFCLLAAFGIGAQLFFMGTDGWDMPIQTIKVLAIAPMNMIQAELYEYAFALLGAIGFAGVTMLLSASTKNKVWSLLLGLAVAYGPMILAEYLPYSLQKALDLLPLSGSAADIFRTNTFRFGEWFIWSPYLLLTVPVAIGIICVPFTVKNWSRRLKV